MCDICIYIIYIQISSDSSFNTNLAIHCISSSICSPSQYLHPNCEVFYLVTCMPVYLQLWGATQISTGLQELTMPPLRHLFLLTSRSSNACCRAQRSHLSQRKSGSQQPPTKRYQDHPQLVNLIMLSILKAGAPYIMKIFMSSVKASITTISPPFQLYSIL